MLPAIARLVERTLAQQLRQHIREHSVLPDFQHGFRAAHSTETALLQLIDGIATGMDQSSTILVASLDLADAVKSADICQYADDVTLTVTAETPGEAVELMNQALREFSTYAAGNRLAAEPSKTQLMGKQAGWQGQWQGEPDSYGHQTGQHLWKHWHTRTWITVKQHSHSPARQHKTLSLEGTTARHGSQQNSHEVNQHGNS
eukprot:gene2140-biopygen6461